MLSRTALLGLLSVIGGLVIIAGVIGTGILPLGSLAPYLQTQVTSDGETPAPTSTETPAASEIPPPAECGNDVPEPPTEECDAGFLNGEPGIGCTRDCKIPPVAPGYCGNGIVEPPEECDDAESHGLSCTRHCEIIVPPTGCGNNRVEPPEECDDGPDNGFFCTADCKNPEPWCGNGFINYGETCDVGTGLNGKEGSGCSADCQLIQECGNNRIEPPEECDDGNTRSQDGCSAECRKELACLCQYQEVPECAPLTAQGEQVCETTNTSPHYDRPECDWVGGQCMSRFKQYCQQWFEEPEQKNQCTKNFGPTDDKVDPAEIPGFFDFPERRVHRLGHGEGCYNATRRVRSCLRRATRLGVTDLGCSTFANQAEAETYMEALQRDLEEGQEVIFTANTGTGVSDPQFPTCNTLMSYIATIRDVNVVYEQCHVPGTQCTTNDEVHTCTPSAGFPAPPPSTQVCCPKANGSGLGWQEGDSCLIDDVCQSDLSGVVIWYHSCSHIDSAVTDEVIACLNTERDKCVARGGRFKSPDDPANVGACITTDLSDWPWCRIRYACPWKCEGGSAARAALPQRAPAPPPPTTPTTCSDSQTATSDHNDTAPLQCNTPTVAAMRTVATCLSDKEADCTARGGTFTHANQLGSTLQSLVNELRDASTCTITAASEWNCSIGSPTTP